MCSADTESNGLINTTLPVALNGGLRGYSIQITVY
jgi:hypothetical protein